MRLDVFVHFESVGEHRLDQVFELLQSVDGRTQRMENSMALNFDKVNEALADAAKEVTETKAEVDRLIAIIGSEADNQAKLDAVEAGLRGISSGLDALQPKA